MNNVDNEMNGSLDETSLRSGSREVRTNSALESVHRTHSLAPSIISTINEELNEELHQKETDQEKLIENEVTPFQREFWKPQNIMSVEDTPFSNRFLVTLLVIAFSVPGNLARISFQKLTNYENAYINYDGGSVVWINFTASFIMSWCNNAVGFWSLVLEKSPKNKTNMKQLALHTGLTSGFCGSFSTLSSAMIEIFFKTIDLVKLQFPNNGYRVMDFFAATLVTFGMPVFGHILGKHFAIIFDHLLVPKLTNVVSYKNVRIFELCFTAVGLAAIIANIVLTCTLDSTYWYKNDYSFCVLMGAIGALTRFKLSKYNGRFFQPWFPTGTLMANISGCLLIAVVELLMRGLNDGELLVKSQIHQLILNGFSAGFAGSLTTMSSFVNELYNLDHPLFQHIYFWSTFAPCFIIVLLIDGSYDWTKGLKRF